MIGLIGIEEQVDRDFDRALLKASMRRLKVRLRRCSTREHLRSFDEAKSDLAHWSQVYRGMRTVEVEKIVGSVGRHRDFDGSFLPLKVGMGDRWGSIDRAYHRGVELPAVSLYKIGDAYFVRDGNHRVSVARFHGAAAIDAEVVELSGRSRANAAQSTAGPRKPPSGGRGTPPRSESGRARGVKTREWAAGVIAATMLIAAVIVGQAPTPCHEPYRTSGIAQQRVGFEELPEHSSDNHCGPVGAHSDPSKVDTATSMVVAPGDLVPG